MGGSIHAGTNSVMNWTFHATCRSLGLKSGVMHLTCPSLIRVYDSDRSNDAVTLAPRYNSLNHRGGPHMRSLISIDFPAPEMEPESAHVASAVSVP